MLVKEIESMKVELRSWELVDLEKKLRSFQSKVCRLKKIEKRKKEMMECLEKERIIKEVIIEKKEKKVSIYEREKEEIMIMDIEEIMKGIKNVDSIKCIELSKDDDKIDKKKLSKLEVVRKWLVERKEEIKGSSKGLINVSDVIRKLEDIESMEELKKWLLEKSKQGIKKRWVGGMKG